MNYNELNKALICNNCLGGKFYKEHNYEFNNPFMWSFIELPDFIKLIKTFNDIDFYNPKFQLIKGNTNEYVNAVIGDNINLNFIHYLYDNTKDIPTKIDTNIVYKNILDYAKEKYFERLAKMPSEQVFLVSTNSYTNEEHFLNSYGENILEQLNKLGNENEIIVILDKAHKINSTYENLKIITEDNIYSSNPAEILIKNNNIDKAVCNYIF